MLIAGEASGDLLAAELVSALRAQSSVLNPPSSPVFFGAGGARMASAGVELTLDMTQHAVIGISDVLKNYFKFRRLFHQLLALAIERKPDAVIGVDYGGFNLRFGLAVKEYIRENPFASRTRKSSSSCRGRSRHRKAGPGESAGGGLRSAPEHLPV